MLKQPIGQVRLTNVAMIRYIINNRKFEIACYKNKAIEWRKGAETDLDEVLQTNDIYSNVSQGELISGEELEKFFPKMTKQQIIKTILEKGELQIGERERDEKLQSMFKDVANILVEKCVHPVTKRPISLEAIKAAMKEIHCLVKLDQSAKKQALEIFKQLQKKYMIARAEMKIQMTIPSSKEDILSKGLKERNVQVIEMKKESDKIATAVMLIEPSKFRELAQFLRDAIPEGSLEVLIPYLMNKEKTNLEELDNAEMLQLRTDQAYTEETFDSDDSDDGGKGKGKKPPVKHSKKKAEEEEKQASKPLPPKKKKKKKRNPQVDPKQQNQDSDSEDELPDVKPLQASPSKTVEIGEKTEGEPAKQGESTTTTAAEGAFKCSTCKGAVFEKKEDFRVHFKSEWHLFSLKRKQSKGEPLSLEEYTNMMLEQEIHKSFGGKTKG